MSRHLLDKADVMKRVKAIASSDMEEKVLKSSFGQRFTVNTSRQVFRGF